MSIIDSIYESTQSFVIKVKDTDNYILMRRGEIDNVAIIMSVNEMYNENIDCKILSFQVKNLTSVSKGLIIDGIIAFEFMDKHVVVKLSDLNKKNNLNPNYLKSEYELIPKEIMVEIKGGIYETEKELMDNII